MARAENTAVAHEFELDEQPQALRVVEPTEGGPRNPPATSPVSNTRVAMAMMLVAETMFFSGLIGAYLVFRVGSVVWPPPGLPALPLAVTWVNTIFLLLSGITVVKAVLAIRGDDRKALSRWLLWTVALGAVFVAIQGSEWVGLVHHGLTLSSGPYGGTFYVLIGTHALHVLGGILWVLAVTSAARGGRYSAAQHDGVEACAIYWIYVCAMWGVLFAMVYH